MTSSLPLSAIVRAKNVEEPKKKTREDWRKAKELEEARKAGTAPAAVDEEGKDINPHIPQYIAQAPWYFGAAGPTLKHQRPQPEKQKEFSSIYDWYSRGVQTVQTAKYRKGACENCGAMTHKKKECFERPRKVGAKYTGDDIAPDEHAQPILDLDYDGKRDRWNGYNPEEHRIIVEEFAKIEEAKRQLKAEKLKQDLVNGDGTSDMNKDADSDINEDEDKYVDDIDMPGTKVDSKQRITVRNLRIREDTAKYLRNLDPNSAYYDPKTRSMRDNPYKNTGKIAEEVQFAGDNFVRYTGDTQKHAAAQLFAWEAYEKGVDVHLLAEPTKLELLNQEFDKRKIEYKNKAKDGILEKYGGAEHLEIPSKDLLLAQTEQYVEFSRHGKVIKGLEKAIVRSKYEEDVYTNNHTSVWGSFWHNGHWGYTCCHQFVKNSVCIGEAGKLVIEDQYDVVRRKLEAPPQEENDTEKEVEIIPQKSLLEEYQDKLLKKQQKKKEKKKRRKEQLRKKKMTKKGSKVTSSESSSDSSSEEEDEEAVKQRKLKLALLMEEENKRQAERILAMDERKRPYNSMQEVQEPTEEEMEAYYMKKRRADDPMADFIGK